VAAEEEKLRVEPLGSDHDRSGFESGVESLDRYFRSQAGQDARKNMAAPFVLVQPDGAIAGYYTLSSTSVQLSELPEQTPSRKSIASRWLGGALPPANCTSSNRAQALNSLVGVLIETHPVQRATEAGD
jgi:hypothetical protein